MVQPKGGKKSIMQSLQENHEQIQRDHPILDSRWYVVEITPSKRIWVGDGHGGSDPDWTREEVNRVSDMFKSQDEAKDWMNQHEPDPGKSLDIKRKNLRRYNRWVDF